MTLNINEVDLHLVHTDPEGNETNLFEVSDYDITYKDKSLATKEDIPDISGKLDKYTGAVASGYPKIYGVSDTGEQTVFSASVYRGAGALVMRDTDAQINVPDTPTNDSHAASKKYVDESIPDISDKLDKVSTAGPGTQYTRVYTIDNDGNQTITNASSSRGNNCLVIRDATANINVPDTPGNQYHATSKKYVDETIAAAIPDISGKLDKVTGATTYAQAYYKTAAGGNAMRDCRTDAATTQSILMRDGSGYCKVIDPVNELDIANKEYVDNAVASVTPTNMVTIDTQQTITGHKIFDQGSVDFATSGNTAKAVRLYATGGIGLYDGGTAGTRLAYLTLPRTDGTLALTSELPTQSFVNVDDLVVVDDVNYKSNDTYSNNNGYFSANGLITGAQLQIAFPITVEKSLKNINSITVDACSLVIRGVNGYINGSSYVDYATADGYTITATKANNNTIYIQIVATTAFPGSVNNTPLNVLSGKNGFKLTFH